MANNIGANIANERHTQQMTQEQLAELSDLTINYLSKIERGVSTQLSAVTLHKIAAALGVKMDDLMSNNTINTPHQVGPNQRQLNQYLNALDDHTSEQLSKSILTLIKLGHYSKK